MRLALQVVLAPVVFVAIFYFSYWVVFGSVEMSLGELGFSRLAHAVGLSLPGVTALLAAVWLWRSLSRAGRPGSMSDGTAAGLRSLVAVLVFLALFFPLKIQLDLMLAGLTSWIGLPQSVAGVISTVAALPVAFLMSNRARRGLSGVGGGLLGSIMTGCLLVGSIGFVGGFFGPILFAPEANQGPLLGILFTGPLGFLLGGVLGAAWWKRGRREELRNG